MRLSRLLLTILVLVLLNLATTFAQDSSLKPSKVIKPKGSEINLWILDMANHEAGQKTVLIIVGFRGIEDTKRQTLKRRLHTAKSYLLDVRKTRNHSNLVVAASTETGKYKYGGIEIYVKGKLYDVLTSYKDAVLNLGPIVPPGDEDDETRKVRKLLYPWRY